MVELAQIEQKILSYQPNATLSTVRDAYAYSQKAHEGQKRKSGDPYFVHPSQVAEIITDLKLDVASVSAALLHDVVEDTGITEEEITDRFGKEVAFLVDGVTKLGRLNFTSKEDQQAESFRKMLVAMASDIRVLLIKLSDRLDNMRSLEFMKVDSQERIAKETLEIYAPLAGRLGIQWIKAELEDLSFKYLYPDVYAELALKAEQTLGSTDEYIETVTRLLEAMLVARGFAAKASGRRKHLYSIYRKMRMSQCEFEQVQDTIAFRLVMENVADCYAALGVIHSEWTPIPGRFKDFIALPKPNMYQSVHTTVIGPQHHRIEIQIRTPAMHATAELGIAAHWAYKEGSARLDPVDAEKFSWLRQLMEVQKEVSDPAEFIESVKVDLFSDEVFVFTPKGDVKVFPIGASPIDFAFGVHTHVGERCTGARVNGAIVPLRYQLHNGDVVEIITHPSQRPSKDWLEFVVTAKAKSRIRSFLRIEGRKKSLELGANLIDREAHKQKVPWGRLSQDPAAMDKLLKAFRVGSLDELLVAVGYGKISARDLITTLKTDERPPPKHSKQPTKPPTATDDKRAHTGIRLDDIDNIVVRYAKCCQPVPGDPVTGWITRGRGVTVHRRECPRAIGLDPERKVDIQWSENARIDRPVALRVVASDRPGILAAMSAAIAQNGININNTQLKTQGDGRALTLFEVHVNSVGTLRSVMRSIAKIDGVYEVERV